MWNAFTQAKQLCKWWGPKEGVITDAELDFRVGGYFHYSIHLPDKRVIWGKFAYHEIKPIDHIVYVDSFSDEKGNIVRAPFSALFPLEILNVLTLAETEGKTTLTLRGGPIRASEEEIKFFEGICDSMHQGFSGMFDVLDDYLKAPKQDVKSEPHKTTTITLTKQFNRSCEKVFDAWLDPKRAGKWLFATQEGEMQKVEINPRVGGSFAIIEKRGEQIAEHRGTYLIIERPTKLKFSFGGPGFPDTYVTIELTSKNNGCELMLTHEGVWAQYAQKTREGWMGILENLAVTLEN